MRKGEVGHESFYEHFGITIIQNIELEDNLPLTVLHLAFAVIKLIL